MNGKVRRITRREVNNALVSAGVPLSPAALMRRLDARNERDRQKVERHLEKLQRDGVTMRDRRGNIVLVEAVDGLAGTVVAHRDGHGFLHPDNGAEDCYIPPREMLSVLHGDKVLARIVARGRRGKPEVHIVELLESGTRRIVGRFQRQRGIGVVIPEDSRILHDVVIPEEPGHAARPGQVVVCEVIQHPFGRHNLVGRIAEVIGHHMEPGMETEIAIRRYELPLRMAVGSRSGV